jgi:hypothetical protein
LCYYHRRKTKNKNIRLQGKKVHKKGLRNGANIAGPILAIIGNYYWQYLLLAIIIGNYWQYWQYGANVANIRYIRKVLGMGPILTLTLTYISQYCQSILPILAKSEELENVRDVRR